MNESDTDKRKVPPRWQKLDGDEGFPFKKAKLNSGDTYVHPHRRSNDLEDGEIPETEWQRGLDKNPATGLQKHLLALRGSNADLHQKINTLTGVVQELKDDVVEVKGEIAGLKTEFAGLKTLILQALSSSDPSSAATVESNKSTFKRAHSDGDGGGEAAKKWPRVEETDDETQGPTAGSRSTASIGSLLRTRTTESSVRKRKAIVNTDHTSRARSAADSRKSPKKSGQVFPTDSSEEENKRARRIVKAKENSNGKSGAAVASSGQKPSHHDDFDVAFLRKLRESEKELKKVKLVALQNACLARNIAVANGKSKKLRKCELVQLMLKHVGGQ